MDKETAKPYETPSLQTLMTTFSTLATLATFKAASNATAALPLSLSAALHQTRLSSSDLLVEALTIAHLLPNCILLSLDQTRKRSDIAAWSLQFDEDAQLGSQITNPKTKKQKKNPTTVQKLDIKRISLKIQSRTALFKDALDKFVLACPGDTDAYSVLVTTVIAKHGLSFSSKSDSDVVDGAGTITGIITGAPKKTQPAKVETLDLGQFLSTLKDQPIWRGQIENEADGWKIVDARKAAFGSLNTKLSPALTDALFETNAVVKLYSHQAQAINALEQGSHVIVSTSTARSLSELLYNHSTLAYHLHENQYFISTYDGDTPFSAASNNGGKNQPTIRDLIRDTSRVLFTNFDTLHKAFQWHKYWIPLFQNLKLVVVDGNGNFTFLVHLLCRLNIHQAQNYITMKENLASTHMTKFFDVENVTLVNVDGSPLGKKHLIVWNPPPLDPMYVGIKQDEDEDQQEQVVYEVKQESDDFPEVSNLEEPSSGIQRKRKRPVKIERVFQFVETVTLCMEFLRNEIRFICFVKTRKSCELLLREFYDRFEKLGTERFRDRVMSYRGGYSQEERREIEKQMFDGKLFGIIATNALELGVDIGTLDVVVHLGVPKTMASYRQQMGRAGRRRNDSASIMIADGNSRVDQHFVRSPQDLFSGNPDTIHLPFHTSHDTINLHLHCFAAEIPLSLGTYTQILASLNVPVHEFNASDPALLWDPIHEVYFAARVYEGNPSKTFQIREGGEEEPEYRVIDVQTNRDIEFVEYAKAFFLLYDGAIFMHRGQSFFILDVDHAKRISRARITNVPYITKIRDYKQVSPYKVVNRYLPQSATRPAYDSLQQKPLLLEQGQMKLTTISNGYFKLHPQTFKKLEAVDMGNETNRVESIVNGFWWDDVCGIGVDGGVGGVGEKLRVLGHDLGESVHAAGHAIYKAVVEGLVLEEDAEEEGGRGSNGFRGFGVKGIECHCPGMYGIGKKRFAFYVLWCG
ncbi:UNVERIFIED_CONTAM: hypothetical protein HDU68_008026 [Siphonaria sp. JEL0065]|nr:hypothetical protein HDU68_008026 [Siphonaria sp. JEL0065]